MCEWYSVDEHVCQACSVEAGAESETASHHPQDVPFDFREILFLEDACYREHRKRHQRHDVSVEMRPTFGHPQQNRDRHGDCHNPEVAVKFGVRLDFDF